eukprot:5762248-Prymnesium_polylepis.1
MQQVARRSANALLHGKVGVCWQLMAEHARMQRIALRSGRALLNGKVGICWNLLVENARRLIMARSVGRMLMQGKLRIGLLTWQSAVENVNSAQDALRHAGRRWWGQRQAWGMDLWKDYTNLRLTLMKLGGLRTSQRSVALRLGLRAMREAAKNQAGTTKTLDAASEMFGNKGRR